MLTILLPESEDLLQLVWTRNQVKHTRSAENQKALWSPAPRSMCCTARHSWVEILRSLNTMGKSISTLDILVHLLSYLLAFQKDMRILFKPVCASEGLDHSLHMSTLLRCLCDLGELVPSCVPTGLTWVGSRANSLEKGMQGVVTEKKGRIMA